MRWRIFRVRDAVGANEEIRLDGFLDEPGAQTAGADADVLGAAVYHRLDPLEVGCEDALGFVVGMAHVMAGLMFLAAEIA